MGKKKNNFWSSFYKETGKNTGKWASNKVFGNKGWATPKRHIVDGFEGGEQAPKSVEKEKQTFLQAEKEKELSQFRVLIDEKIQQLSQTPFPENDRELVAFLFEIEVVLNAHQWDATGGKSAKIKNEYSDALLIKYGQGIEILEIQHPNTTLLNRLFKQHKKFKRKQFVKKNSTLIILIVMILAMAMLMLFAKK